MKFNAQEHIMNKLVSSPDPYIKGRHFEPLDVIRDWGLLENHYLASAPNYIARYGRKDTPSLDLRKALHYLSLELERYEEEKTLLPLTQTKSLRENL